MQYFNKINLLCFRTWHEQLQIKSIKIMLQMNKLFVYLVHQGKMSWSLSQDNFLDFARNWKLLKTYCYCCRGAVSGQIEVTTKNYQSFMFVCLNFFHCYLTSWNEMFRQNYNWFKLKIKIVKLIQFFKIITIRMFSSILCIF